MALIAVHAVIDIPRNARMQRIRLPRRVTVGALENGKIVRVGVACGANAVCVPMIHGEPRVVKRGARPTRSRVARRASSGETCRGVIRIRSAGIISLVTRIAVRRRPGENTSHVAQVASNCCVCAGQRKGRVVVIEGGVEPRRRGVANRAIGGVAQRHVIRYGAAERRGVVVVLRVAPITIRRQRSGIVVRMTGGAGNRCMRTRQRKGRVVVVKGGIQPTARRVAQCAILGKI